MRHTVCANLNDADPEQAEILRRLDACESVSAEIVAALKAWFGGEKLVGISEYELGELRARMAWLEQNQAGAPVAAAAQQPGQPADVAQQAEPALSEAFLAGIKKLARPGIRLET